MVSTDAGRGVTSLPTRRWTVLVLTAGLTFLLRFALAGKESYWLDELYAVYLYVVQPGSLPAAVSSLAETSIHPPLYQGLLYVWVALFGDGEAATRTLSNVAVTVAVIALHRAVVRLHGWRTANTVAVLFSISYIVTYYGLETRSYGLTLGLATVASYLLVRCLEPLLGVVGSASAEAVVAGRRWAVPTRELVWLSVVQLLVLFVHYYNLFFWGAQAAFMVLFVLWRAPRRRWAEAGRVLAALVLQLVVFALVWGRVTLASFETYQGDYAVEQGVSNTPAAMLSDLVRPSFRTGLPATVLVGAAIAAVAVGWWWRRSAARSGDVDADVAAVAERANRRLGFGLAYWTTMTLGPLALAFLAFVVLQQERFFDRYLIFVLPGVAVLLVLAVRELLAIASARLATRDARWRLPDPAHLALVVLLPVVLPGFVDAARYEKVDWRGVAADVVAVVESDPDKSYFVYETSSRTTPVIDYYFERMGSDVRVDATMRRIEERNAQYPFETDERIAEHDYVLVIFTHHLVGQYPTTLPRLEERFEVHHRQVDDTGRGYIVYEVGRVED
ncbi:MAG: glycosyltransferase family 39 protein [Actinobacteria bacterium]|jgi:uncharacterized membrane protein|nr:glycosyltransferase family 39 protein [Actinomycetota bacterium]